MWGKISDDTIFTCSNCGFKINPYAYYDVMGLSPEQMFSRMPVCPKCGHWAWMNGGY